MHTVNFPGDPYPIHIDATFTPLRPGLILNNPQRRLPAEQRAMFEKNGWEIVDSAQPAHNSPPPLCYSSTWLSMNVLVLDPKTVCVEKSEVYQAEQMDKLGMEVIEVELRDAYRPQNAATSMPSILAVLTRSPVKACTAFVQPAFSAAALILGATTSNGSTEPKATASSLMM